MKRSIRTKITLWFTSVLLVVLLMFSALTYFVLEKSLISSVDTKLRSLAVTFSRRIMEPGAVFLQFLDRTGSLKLKEGDIKNAVIPISLKGLRRANEGKITFETIESQDGLPLRVITYPFRSFEGEYSIIQIATSIERVRETMKTFMFIALFTVPMFVFISVLGGVFITDRVLSPIKEITRAAKRISSENLEERLEIRGDDELSELARTFNEMIERLERSFNRIREFSADVSHELRTPLTALKGQMEVALLRDREKEEYREILKSSLEEIDRLTKVVNGLLTISRGEAGRMFLEKSRVDLGDVAAEAAAQLYPLMDEKGLELSLDKRGSGEVVGDRNLLKQMFINLLENATKYNVEGGSIGVSIEGLDGEVRVVVEDTGIGIPEEDLPKIFEKFYRVDKSRARGVGGAGLGLSIVKWIVSAHGGTIKVKSTLGKGTAFEVLFPREVELQ